MKGNWNYVFVKGWNDVLDANKSNSFKEKDVFPLWSFRSGTGKLCFALTPKIPATALLQENLAVAAMVLLLEVNLVRTKERELVFLYYHKKIHQATTTHNKCKVSWLY
ncbi:B3 domain-containing protein [Arabidopsis thaliana]